MTFSCRRTRHLNVHISTLRLRAIFSRENLVQICAVLLRVLAAELLQDVFGVASVRPSGATIAHASLPPP